MYPPNQNVTNVKVFNGGTPGTSVSPGKYALDWLTSLGGTATASVDGATLHVSMPFQQDGTPTPIPDNLNAMLTVYRHSVLAAINGVVYPPGSDQLPPNPAPYWP